MAGTRTRWLWLGALPVLLLLVAFWLLLRGWGAFDAGIYQEALLHQLSGWLGRPVRVEGVDVGFLPPRLRLLGVRVEEGSGASPSPLFTARVLEAAFNLGALLGNEPAIRRLRAEEPTLHLRQDQSGQWNLFAPADRRKTSTPAGSPEAPAALPVRDWSVERGTVVLERHGQSAVTLRELEAALTSPDGDSRFPFRLRFRSGDGVIEAEGQLGWLSAGDTPRFSLNSEVSLDRLPSEQVTPLLGFPALPASAASLSGSLEFSLEDTSSRLSGSVELRMKEGQALDPLSGWRAEGSARLKDLSCRLAEKAAPVRIQSVQTSFRPGHLEATLKKVALGSAEFDFEGKLDNYQAPRVVFSLSGPRINLTGLQPYFASSSSSTKSGRRYPVALRTARGKGDLTLDRLREGDPGLGPFTGEIQLESGTVRVRPVQIGLYAGKATGGLVLHFAAESVRVDLQLQLTDVDLNPLISAHSTYRDRVFGRLNGSLRVNSQTAAPGLVSSSQGEAEITVTEGRLAAVSLSRELSLVTEAIGLRIKRGDTPVERMTASIQIGDGWARTGNLVVDSPDFLLTGEGGFSFEEVLRLDAVAALSPEVVSFESPVGWIGQLTGAWPTDEEGRILLPVQVRGSFSEPRYRLDATRLAELKLKRRLPDLPDIFKRPPG